MNILLLFLLFLVSCQSTDKPRIQTQAEGTTAYSGQAMTMQYKILIGDTLSPDENERVISIIQKTFQDTDAIFNKWNPNSELSKLNRLKANVEVPLSPYLLRLFKETAIIVALSDRKFDPTIEPLQALWKQKLIENTTPSEKEIASVAPAIGWDKITFTNGMFIKKNADTKLDFGGIAKGLCIDLLVERLLAAGFSNHYVEWGGEIRASGQHPQRRPWNVYISRLGDTSLENAISIVPLNNQAIATSGDYLQNWTVSEKTSEGNEKTTIFFHIFDPQTLRPIEASYTSVASVSVIAPNCALADGLATIPMMFSTISEATKWAETIKETFPETTFWIISRSESVHSKL